MGITFDLCSSGNALDRLIEVGFDTFIGIHRNCIVSPSDDLEIRLWTP
jgi:hypothetical protein